MKDHKDAPTTEDVQRLYVAGRLDNGAARPDPVLVGVARGEFKLWHDAEIRRAKAEGFYEAANCLHVLNCGCMAHIGFINPYAEARDDD